MANTRSAEKNIRKTRTRTASNQATKSRIRTIRKRVLGALAKGDEKEAQVAFNEFSSVADKAAKTNTIHRNTASRLKSRIASKFKKTAA